MEKRYTPGPWEVHTDYSQNTHDEQLGVKAASVAKPNDPTKTYAAICLVTPVCDATETDRANAQLIAAAPDLVETLLKLKARCEGMRDKGIHGCTYGDTAFDSQSVCYGINETLDSILSLINPAISKALQP